MVRDGRGTLGPFNHREGTPDSFHISTTSDLQPSTDKAAIRREEASSPTVRTQLDAPQRGDRGSSRTSRPGILLPPFLGTKAVRRVEVRHRPQETKRADRLSALQDGVGTDHQSSATQGRVGSIRRSFGRILPLTRPSEVSQVLARERAGHIVPVQSDVFRTLHGSSYLHESHEVHRSLPAVTFDLHTHVPRRLAHSSGLTTAVDVRRPVCDRPGIQTRMYDKREEVGTSPDSSVPVSRHVDQPTVGISPPDPGGSRKDQVLVRPSETVSSHDSQDVPQLPGSPRSRSGLRSVRSSLHTPSAVLPTVLLEAADGTGSSDRPEGQLLPTPIMVGGRRPSSEGSPPDSTKSSVDDVHGRQQFRLGSVLGRQHGCRPVVPTGGYSSHQLPRNVGGTLRVTTFPRHCQSESSLSHDGQYHSSVTHQKARRDSFSFSLHPDTKIVRIVHVPRSDASGMLHRGQTERPGRPTVQEGPDPTVRMDASTECVPRDPQEVSDSRGGPVRHTLDAPASEVCVPIPGRSGMGDRRSVDQLGRDNSLRLSSDDTHRSGTRQGAVVGGSTVLGSAQVAHTGMVLHSTEASSRLPAEDPSMQEATTTTQPHGISLHSDSTEPTRLARIKDGLMEAGFSEEAATRAAQPQRQSSLILYQSRWRVFCRWCDRRNIDPYTSTVQQIADFLLFLFNVQGCVPTTVAGYRTAISQTRAPVDGLPIGLNPVLTNILKNIRLEVPRKDNRVPEWDLDVVLEALREPPFEPPSWNSAESRKFCTFKTVFLLALATGARRSELHALSRSARDLVISDKGISLKTLPGFLAKNQIPGHDPGPFVVKALSPFTGRDSADRLLCPVRMLKFYLHFTQSAAGKSGPLFAKLTGNGYPKSQTISAWIKNLIRLIYERKGLSVQGHAHEVRRLAASWAYFSGVSTAAIVEAGRWRSQSSFTSFYLADVVRQRDGFYRPIPCIAMRALCRV